jgi:hypothetical protein
MVHEKLEGEATKIGLNYYSPSKGNIGFILDVYFYQIGFRYSLRFKRMHFILYVPER